MGGHTPPAGEGLCRGARLTRRAQFLRCYRRGRRRRGAFSTLHFHPNRQSTARLGITASRKVGKAVMRHRLKRRVREIYRRFPQRRALPPVDIVVHLQPAAAAAPFAALESELQRLLGSLGRADGRSAGGTGARS